MGGIWSATSNSGILRNYNDVSQDKTSKRQRISTSPYQEKPRLIPCLPDEISIQILARLPRIYYYDMRLVSLSWKEAIMSLELWKVRKDLGTTEEWLYMLTKTDDDKLSWLALDPLSNRWQRLPPLPAVAYEDEPGRALSPNWMWNVVGPTFKLADMICKWLRRKDALNQMSLCGCAVGAIGGSLYMLGGFSRSSTMRCVWQFDPISNAWSEVNSMSTGRAYCKTGTLNDKLYVVGGVSRDRGGFNPLQSAEVFDPSTGSWSLVPNMPFSKAQMLPTAFLIDMLKPIATGMISYMGKLCVPQSLYSWPFFVDVGGEMYDPETNSWTEMPLGMGEGWPARQAGTKLSVVVDGELYALEPSGSLESGKIKVYDKKEDAWRVAINKVPKCDTEDSESPYLLAGFHGKLHVISKSANHEIVVLQADIRRNSDSPSTSFSSSGKPFYNFSDPHLELETIVWKVVACRSLGSAELVSCVVLDL